jgi:hypothetical protein
MTTALFPPIVTGGMDTCRIQPRSSGAESCFFCLQLPADGTRISVQIQPASFPIFSKPYFPAFTVSGEEFGKGPSRTFVSEPKSIRSGNSNRVLAGRNFSNTQTGIAARIPAVSQTLFPNKTDYEPAPMHSFKYTAGSLYLQQQQNQRSG